MDYDIKTIEKWEAPKGNGAPILCMPNVPLPMHSSAPRTIEPKRWDFIRKRCYMLAGYKCEASGKELGHGKCHSHELYSIDYAKQTMTFDRPVCLDPHLHTIFIHSGRAITMFERGDSTVPKSLMLSTLEEGFAFINRWNKEHPDEEPLRVSTTFLEWKKNPSLHYEVEKLIEQYKIKFYTFDKSCFNKTNWSKWKLIWKGSEYPTKFATQKEWEEHFNPTEKSIEKPVEHSSFNKLDKIIKEAV